MENPIKMDDLGVFPYFWKHPYESVAPVTLLLAAKDVLRTSQDAPQNNPTTGPQFGASIQNALKSFLIEI